MISGPERLAAKERPALARVPLTGPGVCVLGFQRKAGIDGEVKQGLVLKSDCNRVIFTGGKDFGVIDDLALHLFEAVKLAAVEAADGGLTAPDDLRPGETRGAIVVFWVWPWMRPGVWILSGVWVRLWVGLRRGRRGESLAPGKQSVYFECQPCSPARRWTWLGRVRCW